MLSGTDTSFKLDSLLNPASIAIVGASSNPAKQGNRYIRQLLNFGFKGKLYPVNPRGGEILGLKTYESIGAIPDQVDYAISTIPAENVPQLIQECRRKGIKLLQLYTAELGETGIPERKQLEEHIASLARQAGIRLLGPNCMGVHNPEAGITFRFDAPREKGEVGFFSQSAGHCAEVMYRSAVRGLAFSKAISYGNAADINETELLEYFDHDPGTKVIMAYIEGVRSRRFAEVLRAAASHKPVIIFKAGRTAGGARAAASHTGSLAGSYNVWKGLMRQCGAIEVESLEELVDTAIAFSKLPPPRGRKVGAIGAGGGGSILAADELELRGLEMPPLPKDIIEEVQTFLGDDWIFIKNPIDTSIVIPAGWGWEAVQRIFTIVAAHPFCQILLGDAGEWVPDAEFETSYYRKIIDLLLGARAASGKPMAIVLRPADHAEEWRWRVFMEQQKRCAGEGAAIYPSVARAARALGKLADYHLGHPTKL